MTRNRRLQMLNDQKRRLEHANEMRAAELNGLKNGNRAQRRKYNALQRKKR